MYYLYTRLLENCPPNFRTFGVETAEKLHEVSLGCSQNVITKTSSKQDLVVSPAGLQQVSCQLRKRSEHS